MNKIDYQHSDWLLFSTQKLLESIQPTLSFTYKIKPDGGKNLVVSNISEKTIDNFIFLTNTDQNNNYLYLENFVIFTSNLPSPVTVPGLDTTITNMWRNSDVFSFISGEKTHSPFNVNNLSNTTFTGKTFSEYVDTLTGLLPFVISTYGYVKIYEFELNPDSSPAYASLRGQNTGNNGATLTAPPNNLWGH